MDALPWWPTHLRRLYSLLLLGSKLATSGTTLGEPCLMPCNRVQIVNAPAWPRPRFNQPEEDLIVPSLGSDLDPEAQSGPCSNVMETAKPDYASHGRSQICAERFDLT